MGVRRVLPPLRTLLMGALLAVPAALAGCGDREAPAAEIGKRLFGDAGLSTSPFNRRSCATCHVVAAPGGLPPVEEGRHPGRILPGYNLANTVHRPSWWGGYEVRLLDAVNMCMATFMSGRLLEAGDERARALFEYLVEESPVPDAPALPFTIVRAVTDLADLAGDAERGRDVYDRACDGCHGAPQTASGRSESQAVTLPTASIADWGDEARAAVVEKVRHGRYFSVGGTMPLYGTEVLSDEELADIVAFLGL
jgi:thiosulfate dehydrogenase